MEPGSSPSQEVYNLLMDQKNYIDTVAYICIRNGKILSTRGKGRDTYYIPGGKRDGDETDQEALIREVKEEVAIDLTPETIKHHATFEAQAHGKPKGTIVRMACYVSDFTGEPRANSEIAEIVWLGYEARDRSSHVDQLLFDDLKGKGLLP
jgi:8-oxo-dGTP pyrophosphatase MutT (NUDIX family)